MRRRHPHHADDRRRGRERTQRRGRHNRADHLPRWHILGREQTELHRHGDAHLRRCPEQPPRG